MSPCIDPVLGPTVVGGYWSATTLDAYPTGAQGRLSMLLCAG